MEGIFIVGSLGLAVAATVLVGRAVGSGDLTQALDWASRIKRIGVLTGIGFGLFYAISVLVVPLVFKNAGSDVQNLAIALILTNSVLQVVKVRNMILAGGILTSGSDVKGVIYGDLLSVVVGLPLAVVLGLYTPLGIWGIMIARAVDELVKLAVFEFRARRLDWEKLVAEHNPAAPDLH
jgi:Na+-driven multidrug efflux pump